MAYSRLRGAHIAYQVILHHPRNASRGGSALADVLGQHRASTAAHCAWSATRSARCPVSRVAASTWSSVVSVCSGMYVLDGRSNAASFGVGIIQAADKDTDAVHGSSFPGKQFAPRYQQQGFYDEAANPTRGQSPVS
jgi:hypothetical protein